MKAHVVVGANYGDEGKGLITDYLTRQTGSRVVCRFNGGAQAAHTVVTDEFRHVFNSVGSGTFAGADTYLSKQFIFNPYVLSDELNRLSIVGKRPRIYCHSNARVTTIFDIAINNILEMSRGDDRHGSCGLGINETVVRSENCDYRLLVRDIFSKRDLVEKLKKIKTEWIPHRLCQLGLSSVVDNFHARTNNILLNEDYDYHADTIMKVCNHIMSISTSLKYLVNDNVIFEGAQGLGLDQDLGHFPHVTRSHTGVYGALHAMNFFDVDQIQPIYVTRAYVTRHGAGPLEHEGEINNLSDFDNTNVPNQWQGSLRFAPMDLGVLKHMITKDWIRSSNGSTLTILQPKIAITCLDQQGEIFSYDINGHHRCHDNIDDFIKYFEEQVGFRVALASFGPTAKSVTELVGQSN